MGNWWQHLDPGWKLGLWLLVALRVVLGVVGFIAVEFYGDRDLSGQWGEFLIQGGEPGSLVLSIWQRWDALWYQRIAEEGYAPGNSTTNFYPLLPLLTKVVSVPLGGGYVIAALLVAAASFVAAVFLLYQLTLRLVAAAYPGRAAEDGPRVARLTVLFMCLFPTGFFLVAPFTEGIFLATTLAAFWFGYRGQWWWAGAMGFLAALTRANGAVVLLPIAFMYARDRGLWTWVRRRGGLGPNLAALALLLPVAGAMAWQLYVMLVVQETRSSLLVGGLRRFVRRVLPDAASQEAVARENRSSWETVWPWDAISASVENIRDGFGYLAGTRPGVGPESLVGVELLNLVSLLVFCGLGVVAIRKLPLEYSLFLWPNLFVLLTRKMEFQPLLSTGRYVVVLFPCFMLLALFMVRRPAVWIPWLTISSGVQLILFQLFVRWRFIA